MPWRLSTEADDPRLEAMILALYDEDPGSAPMTLAKARRTLRALRDVPTRGVAIVAEEGGDLAGYALLCAFWSNELGGSVCIIDELYVARAFRSRGLGSGLVQDLIAGRAPWFRDAVALELEVTPANTRARALYTRLGFHDYKNAVMRFTGGRPPTTA